MKVKDILLESLEPRVLRRLQRSTGLSSRTVTEIAFSIASFSYIDSQQFIEALAHSGDLNLANPFVIAKLRWLISKSPGKNMMNIRDDIIAMTENETKLDGLIPIREHSDCNVYHLKHPFKTAFGEYYNIYNHYIPPRDEYTPRKYVQYGISNSSKTEAFVLTTVTLGDKQLVIGLSHSDESGWVETWTGQRTLYHKLLAFGSFKDDPLYDVVKDTLTTFDTFYEIGEYIDGLTHQEIIVDGNRFAIQTGVKREADQPFWANTYSSIPRYDFKPFVVYDSDNMIIPEPGAAEREVNRERSSERGAILITHMGVIQVYASSTYGEGLEWYSENVTSDNYKEYILDSIAFIIRKRGIV